MIKGGENRKRHSKFEPSLETKSTNKANLSQAYTQENTIRMIPEEFKHT